MQVKRIYRYPLDLLGVLETNLISGERYDVNAAKFPIIIANEGVFYADTLVLIDGTTGVKLKPNIDYKPVCYDIDASAAAAGRACYAAFQFLKRESAPPKVFAEYRLIGGEYVNRVSPIIDAAINVNADKRQAEWENILNKPTEYPPMLHNHYLSEITDWGALIQAIRDCRDALLSLTVAMEARILKMIHNLDVDNKAEHQLINALLNSLTNNLGSLKIDVDNLKNKLTNATDTFDMFALKKTKVNGYPLSSDITLKAEDVDAVSATHGGVFQSSFIDVITNYGRTTGARSFYITDKHQIDEMVTGTIIQIYKKDWSVNVVPMAPGLGQIIKLANNHHDARLNYQVLLYSANGEAFQGYADLYTSIRWTKIVTGEIPSQVPPGTMLPYVGVNPPDGFFLPMGQQYDMRANPVLAKLLPYGVLPDLRGSFLRMLDYGRGLDPDSGRGMLSFQDYATKHWYANFRSFDRQTTDGSWDQGISSVVNRWSAYVKHGGNDLWGSLVQLNPAIHGNMANETRPKNYAVNYILKAG